jgi:hypothetical protein
MSIDDKTHTILTATATLPASLTLEWSNGTRAELNVAKWLGDPRVFAQVRVGEWGHSVEWPDGTEIGAEALWLETLSAIGREDTRGFLEWRLRHGLSLSKTADALGLSRRMVAYYSNGEKIVPKPILLACKGWEVTHAVASTPHPRSVLKPA